MRSFILLTFLFMGLGYYELSGGGDFVAEPRTGAALVAADTAGGPDMVTRDDTTDPADVGALPGVPERLAQPLVTPQVPAQVEVAVADAIAAALASAAPDLPQVEDSPVLVSLTTQRDDMRQVDASSLNVRAGPSTSDSVVAQVIRNETVQVLSELDDGWTLIRVGDVGTEGWVASRFLTR